METVLFWTRRIKEQKPLAPMQSTRPGTHTSAGFEGGTEVLEDAAVAVVELWHKEGGVAIEGLGDRHRMALHPHMRRQELGQEPWQERLVVRTTDGDFLQRCGAVGNELSSGRTGSMGHAGQMAQAEVLQSTPFPGARGVKGVKVAQILAVGQFQRRDLRGGVGGGGGVGTDVGRAGGASKWSVDMAGGGTEGSEV